jgi:hypothetical protein
MTHCHLSTASSACAVLIECSRQVSIHLGDSCCAPCRGGLTTNGRNELSLMREFLLTASSIYKGAAAVYGVITEASEGAIRKAQGSG